MKKNVLTKDASQIMRGGGILLMLIHHLFGNEELRPLFDDVIIRGGGLVNQIGIYSNVCVSIFIFISGYGLTISTPSDIPLRTFYKKRLKKLFFNFWFVWIIFVPISIFVFGRTFENAYGAHPYFKAVLEFFGCAKMFDIQGYNPTWWFYNCILILYIIYPFIKKYLTTYPLLITALSLTPIVGLIPGGKVFCHYLLPFIAGIICAKIPMTAIPFRRLELLLSIIIVSLYVNNNGLMRYVMETLICIMIAIYLCKYNLPRYIHLFLKKLGDHSMNIFLFHTFIFYFWFRDIIYMTRNPFVILVELLLICYPLSLLIEKIKNALGFYRLIK